MQSQLRITQLRAAKPAIQRRLFATPAGVPPTPPPPSGAAPIRPVVVTSVNPPLTPGSSTLPPPLPPLGGAVPPKLPPPPPPPRQRGFFRRFLVYTTVGALIFYPLSGWASNQSETYREFFVDTFPGGEWVADQFEGGAVTSSVSQKAAQGWKKVAGESPSTTTQKVEQAAKDARAATEQKAHAAKVEAEKKGSALKAEAEKKAGEAKKAISSAKASAEKKAEEAKESAKSAAAKAEAEAASLKDRVVKATTDAADKAKALAHDAKDKISSAVPAIPFNAGDGIEGVVREAERLVNKGEDKLANAASATKDALTPSAATKDALTPDPNAPRVLPDTQRPRELRPETVTPAKPSFEGKEKYSGPELPLGFEPPPGYYIPPPPKSTTSDASAPAPLPLLAPKVKDFGTDEPIISQLASTIDSLTSSLSAPGSAGTGASAAGATGVLSKAQADLAALSARLAEVKKTEKAKLEKALAEKTKEFEVTLKNAESSRAQTEQGLQDKWGKERQGMVDEWKAKMETELESQREGIEKRLREEVVSQGIELQRRWLRGIKAQVEEERGGRLAKLDHLTTSLKELERITLDNSATLDDNVRVHKVWSALRAVQAKAEAGDASFDEELRVLKSLSSSPSSSTPTAVSSALATLEQSGIPQTGVKSLSALSSWFTTSVSPRIHSASLVPAPEHAGVVSHLASMGLSKIMFRPRPGPVDGNDVGAVLARAEWCLAEKDLDGAAREVNRLDGWPGKLAADWLREARRSLEVRQALEVVATEATLGSLLLV